MTKPLETECEQCLEAWLCLDPERATELLNWELARSAAGQDVDSSSSPATPSGWCETEISLNEEEERALRYYRECESCREELAEFQQQQAQVARYFATAWVPEPSKITPREPLQAASGYPRRVSLTVLPSLLWFLLLALMGIAALGWFLQQLQSNS